MAPLLLALEDGEGLWVTLGGVLVSVLSALTAALITVLTFRGKSKRLDERTAINYYRGLIDDQKTRLALHDRQMADAQKAIDLQREANRDYEVEQEAVWAELVRQHEAAVRLNAYARRCGAALGECGKNIGPPEDAPEMPKRRPRGGQKDAADFAARTAAQGAALISEMDARHRTQTDQGGGEKP